MKTLFNYSLKQSNSFAVESIAPEVFCPSSTNDLFELVDKLPETFYILGEGYNTLLVDETSPVIIKPEFFGEEIIENDNDFVINVSASENWHKFVCRCIKQGINGLENLALIPGSIGAAPVQNIGAYGVELSDYCQSVTWFDFEKKQFVNYDNEQCQFSYRESIFKQRLKNKGLIVSVTFRFPKQWQANLSYAGLDHLPANTSAQQVLNEVIALREGKLPDPTVLPNAGSFFKNPILKHEQWIVLHDKYPSMPSYPQNDDKVKIAAGWLIQEAGLKGYEENGVGIHKKQALVIVNYESNSGQDVTKLAQTVQQRVAAMFGIYLEPEVRAVFSSGEFSLIEK